MLRSASFSFFQFLFCFEIDSSECSDVRKQRRSLERKKKKKHSYTSTQLHLPSNMPSSFSHFILFSFVLFHFRLCLFLNTTSFGRKKKKRVRHGPSPSHKYTYTCSFWDLINNLRFETYIKQYSLWMRRLFLETNNFLHEGSTLEELRWGIITKNWRSSFLQEKIK